MRMKKHDIVEMDIEEIKFPNIGIGHVEGKRVQLKGCLPGQRVRMRILKAGRSVKANLLEVVRPAAEEVAAECDVFGPCGGCAFQHISYEYELELKTRMVKELLAPLEPDAEFLPTIAAQDIKGYRNKMEFSFGDDGAAGNLNLGMRKKGSYYEVVSGAGCLICHPDFGAILAATREYFGGKLDFFHRRKMTGTLRHLVVRRGAVTGEILVNLVTAATDFDFLPWCNMLLDLPLAGRIVGVLHTQNNSVADVIIAEDVRVLYGVDYYYEEFSKKAGGQRFKVGAFSFFQTNSIMAAEGLYSVVAEFAGDTAGKVIFDLYCGTGTIGIFLARHGAQVVGIELVEEAVLAARENAALNNIKNCRFIAGDVRKIVGTLCESPDIIVLDPPRDGINPKAMPHIIAFGAEKIIYVSCKPSSLLRDLPALMAAGYKPLRLRCVDMFARTANVEVVAELVKSDKFKIQPSS